MPGSEIVARPAVLLLELSGTLLSDVMNSRIAIEPIAARVLAENSTKAAEEELRELIEALPSAAEDQDVAQAAAHLHRRIIELSGTPTLAIVAGMLHDITERHFRASIREAADRNVLKSELARLRRSFLRLLDLVVAGDGAGAELHWRKHMETSGALLMAGLEQTRVRDVID